MERSSTTSADSSAVQLAGGRMAVLDQGHGLPVLLGHGFLWDRAMWAPQIRALSRHCRMLVPDMWGHGGSDALPSGTRSLADLADQMVELLDRLEIERCVVAGSSMGGMWAAHLAARAPRRVAGLVVMNSSLAAEPAQQRGVYAAILDRVAAEGAVGEHVADMIAPLFFAGDIDRRDPDLPRELRRRLASFPPAVLRQSIVPLGRMIFDRPDALAILSQIEAPALVIAGAEDRARPASESKIMAEMLDCPLTTLPSCGHTATLEQPDEVSAALLDFLRQLGWTGRSDQRAAG